MARQVPIGVWLEFVEDAFAETIFNTPDTTLYDDVFPRAATVLPPPTPTNQDGEVWHRYWIFLNLVESLVDALKPVHVSQLRVTRDQGGYQLTDAAVTRPPRLQQTQGFTATPRLTADTINNLLPVLSIHGQDTAAHIWNQYPLPDGDVADFAIAFDEEPITFEPGVVAKLTPDHLHRVTCSTADTGALWRIENNSGTFHFDNRGMPPVLVDGKLGEAAWETQVSLGAHMGSNFTRVIVSDRWAYAPDLPQGYVEIRNDSALLDGDVVQQGLVDVFARYVTTGNKSFEP